MIVNKKGITLVALVITIIVLLILAGISIAITLGDEGVIGKAKSAKLEQRYGSIIDEVKIRESDLEIAFEKGEEGFIFSEKTVVRMRFLTDDEIDILWPAANFGAEPTGTEIDQVEDDFNSSTTSGEKLLNEKENTEKVAEETSNDSFALNQSERAELEGYRRERKTQLINSFSDDLSKEFLETLTDKIDEYSYDDLDTALSKEFTRVSREGNRTQKTNTFVYAGEGPNSMAAKTKAEIVKELVETYKTKK